jgi:membrane-associated protease RseP (regulator of RpoE activity)
VTGWGVGGPVRSLVTRAQVLRLGSVTIERPVTELSLQRSGAYTDPYVAGNVGAGLLKRFNLVFDYGRQQIVFEANGVPAALEGFDRTGMWLNLADQAFEVADVTAGGPAAAAGIKAGDRILAVDGVKADRLSLAAVRDRGRTEPPGTSWRLTLATGQTAREVTLVLQDQIPDEARP